jgi:hypothetical protein
MDEFTRMFRIRKTVCKMLDDRGYLLQQARTIPPRTYRIHAFLEGYVVVSHSMRRSSPSTIAQPIPVFCSAALTMQLRERTTLRSRNVIHPHIAMISGCLMTCVCFLPTFQKELERTKEEFKDEFGEVCSHWPGCYCTNPAVPTGLAAIAPILLFPLVWLLLHQSYCSHWSGCYCTNPAVPTGLAAVAPILRYASCPTVHLDCMSASECD